MHKYSQNDAQDTSVAESNKGVHTLRVRHKRWEGDRDTGEVLSPRHWLDKCPQEGGFLEKFQVNRLSGWKPFPWDFLHQRGRDGFISHLFEFYSHLLLLKGKSSPLILASKRET